jgi:hypothetical protein
MAFLLSKARSILALALVLVVASSIVFPILRATERARPQTAAKGGLALRRPRTNQSDATAHTTSSAIVARRGNPPEPRFQTRWDPERGGVVIGRSASPSFSTRRSLPLRC